MKAGFYLHKYSERDFCAMILAIITSVETVCRIIKFLL